METSEQTHGPALFDVHLEYGNCQKRRCKLGVERPLKKNEAVSQVARVESRLRVCNPQTAAHLNYPAGALMRSVTMTAVPDPVKESMIVVQTTSDLVISA